ncbi:MAG: hypothetical protein GC168_17415 [Candidatus Hydrogenedens sp.]|nr:hypothetical protein [Candidatus Hydrogenedens sp.]
MTERTRISNLEAVSLAYLFLPAILFLMGWLKPVVSIPLLMLVLLALGKAWIRARSEADEKPSMEAVGPWQWGCVAAVSLFVVACCGIGGYSFQFFDYSIYNGGTKTLIEHGWPTGRLDAIPADEPVVWAYYVGYYLAPSLIGKALGWAAAQATYFLYAALGVVLISVWLRRLTGSSLIAACLFFLFFGGLDIVGHLMTAAPPESGSDRSFFDYLTGVYWWSIGRGWLDHWHASFAITEGEPIFHGRFMKFYSPISYLVDGPYHIIPPALAVLMFISDCIDRRSASRLLLIGASLPITSTLVMAGCMPLGLLGLWHTRAKQLVSLENAAGLALGLVQGLYFLSIKGEVLHGWLWDFADMSRAWPYVLLVYVLEFGLLALVLPKRHVPGHESLRLWWVLIVFVFLVAPLYQVGEYSDFGMKFIVPAYLMFMVLVLRSMQHQPEAPIERWRWRAAAVLLVIGAWGPLGNIARALEFGFTTEASPYAQTREFEEVLPEGFFRHGQVDTNAAFWKYLAKPVNFAPPLTIPVAQEWDLTASASEGAIWKPQGEHARQTPEGIAIDAGISSTVLRIDGLDIDTARAGTFEIDLAWEGDTPDPPPCRLIMLWASADDVADHPGAWPFLRWRSHVVYPHLRSVSGNAYWRGRIASLAVYLDADANAPARTLTIKHIRLLER